MKLGLPFQSTTALVLVAAVVGFAESASAWRVEECAEISATTLSELTSEGRSCMSVGDRAVTQERLAADAAVIEAVHDALVNSNVRTGMEDHELLEKFARAWARLRWDDQDQPLTGDFLVQSSGYGRLKVKSTPPGAEVWVDGHKWKDPTKTAEWTPEGRKEVKLVKIGCRDAKGETTVQAGKETVFERGLECGNGDPRRHIDP